MVRTWSAYPGGSARWLQHAAPLWVMLFAHLAMLSMLLEQRASSTDTTPVDGMLPALWIASLADPAKLALGTGLLLGCIVILGSNRLLKAAPQCPAEASITAPAATPAAIRWGTVAACVSEDAYSCLMARIGHDLRTPLNALLGFSDLMQSETFGPLGDDRYRAYAAHMHACGLDLLRATESTLAMTALLANPTTGDRAAVSLIDTVAEAWAAASLERGGTACDLNASIAHDLTVRCDPQGCRQGIAHLLNAARLRAIPGAAIDVAAINSNGRVQLRVWTVLSPRHAQFADTGCRSASVGAVEDLPLSLSRTILGLQGLTLRHATDQNGRWTASLDLEAAVQDDFFAAPVSSRLQAASGSHPGSTYSGDFLAGTVSFSRSAAA